VVELLLNILPNLKFSDQNFFLPFSIFFLFKTEAAAGITLRRRRRRVPKTDSHPSMMHFQIDTVET